MTVGAVSVNSLPALAMEMIGSRLEQPMDTQSGTGRLANGLNTLFVSGGEIHQGSGGLRGLIGGFLNSGDKKPQPGFPIARQPHGLQQVIVLLAMLLEIEAEIQQRLVQRALGTKEERDEQSAKASVAVEKRMDVSNWTCAIAALISSGVLTGSLCRNFSSGPRHSINWSGGGGTYTALPGRVPPTQFCERRNSPGSFLLPRPLASRTPWISLSKRSDSGSSASRFNPKFIAAT